MIKINEAKNKLKKDLTLIKDQEKIIIQCFKKDRSISIVKNNDFYEIIEDGYIHQKRIVSSDKECLKEVLSMIKFEFANSTNLWYHHKH